MWIRRFFWPALLVLAGCQSSVPIQIREPLLEAPSIVQVQEDLKGNKGKHVRWGGVIASVENRAADTWVEVVSKALGQEGRPLSGDQAFGRFFARVSGFLDPAVYKPDREVTVYGVVEDTVERPIGTKPYRYPMVKSELLYLWPVYRTGPYGYYPDAYWYDPYWYGPYYSPYWRHRYWRHHPLGLSPYW
jgi:outer membrane lipoprotein